MEAGLGRLGLAPDVFWRMTPRELDAALTGRFGTGVSASAPTRVELQDLMQTFPDWDSES
jgi:uncharacterized phage protein (TIGR02216 family)